MKNKQYYKDKIVETLLEKYDMIDWDLHLLNKNIHLYQKIFKNKQTF